MIVAEISLLHDAAGSQIFPLQFAAGRCDSMLYLGVGVRSYRCMIAGSQILPTHDAAGSQFGSGESSPKTLEDSLAP